MQGSPFDEEGLFRAIAESGVRALLIGRRALVALGIPVLTVDYDFWLHGEDIERLNEAVAPLELYPNRTPEEARGRGRYVLENDERIDVLVAKQATTRDGVVLRFEDAWERRKAVPYSGDSQVVLPCIDDLIVTKRWSLRPKDVDDIELLDKLRTGGG